MPNRPGRPGRRPQTSPPDAPPCRRRMPSAVRPRRMCPRPASRGRRVRDVSRLTDPRAVAISVRPGANASVRSGRTEPRDATAGGPLCVWRSVRASPPPERHGSRAGGARTRPALSAVLACRCPTTSREALVARRGPPAWLEAARPAAHREPSSTRSADCMRPNRQDRLFMRALRRVKDARAPRSPSLALRIGPPARVRRSPARAAARA